MPLVILNILCVFLSLISLSANEIRLHGTGGFGVGPNMPFWSIANQYGKYYNESANAYGAFELEHTLDSNKNIDLGYGTYVQLNAVASPYLYPQELYATFKIYMARVTIGTKEQTYGNASHETSSGNILLSNNARPLPGMGICVPNYWSVPFTNDWVEIKGHFSNEWYADSRYTQNLMVHHKSFFGQLGGDFFINIHMGIIHAAQWGGSNAIFNDLPSSFNDFWWIVGARNGAPVDSLGGESENRYGNHIGSRLFGMDIKAKNWTLNLYWQTIFEDTSGKKMQNMADGLWGIHWSRNGNKKIVQDVTVEYVNTTNQSGPAHILEIDGEKRNFGGDDNYFNHYIYRSGWNHFGMTQGTPFITSPAYTNSSRSINNKSRTLYLGISGHISEKWRYITRLSYGMQYGENLNDRTSYWNSISPAESLFSALLNIKYQPNKTHQLFGSLGVDLGTFFNENIGLIVGYSLRIL